MNQSIQLAPPSRAALTPSEPFTCQQLWQHLTQALPDTALGWVYVQAYTKPVLKEAMWHDPGTAVETPDNETLLNTILNLPQQQWTELPPDESPLQRWSWTIRLASGERNASVLMLATTGRQPLDDEFASTLYWYCLALGIACDREGLTVNLRNSQHLVNYQLIYMESIEWLKAVAAQDQSFYRDLVGRVQLLVDADAVELLQGADRQSHFPANSGRGMDPTSRALIGQWLSQHGEECEKPHYLNDAPQAEQDLAAIQYQHLLIAPFDNAHFQFQGVLVLARGERKQPFSIVEEMYLNQFLSLTASTLERNTLLSALEQRNHELLDERGKQQALIEKLQAAQSQLQQSEKMASIGQLAAGVAHEINNPIGYVMSNLTTLGQYVQTLWKSFEDLALTFKGHDADAGGACLERIYEEGDLAYLHEDLDNLLRETNEGIERVKRIVQDLKDFSRADSGEFHPFDLVKCIEKTLNIVHNELKYKAEVEFKFDDLPLLEAVESQISQVIMNLLVNAAHAIENRGAINVSAVMHGDGQVCISVADTGMGIKPENMSKIFDPFYTSKPVGKGTGLGLSISYSIMQRHHGRIECTSVVGQGTTFYLYLPIAQPQQETAA